MLRGGAAGLGRAKKLWDEGGLDMASYGVTLLPPLALSLAFPGLFFKAADLAGVYGVAILYGVLPPLMAWVLRRQQVLPNAAPFARTRTERAPRTSRLFLYPRVQRRRPPPVASRPTCGQCGVNRPSLTAALAARTG